MANNIEIANGRIVQDSGDRFIQFDLSWENGWRTDDLNGDGVSNWDAAWVFVKYRVPAAEGGDDLWKHVWLSTEDGNHLPGSGTPATIDIGLTEIDGTNRGMGAFIYRSENGTGTFATTGTRLRWDFQGQDVDPADPIEIRIFAIEMVYAAEGAFSVGDGSTVDLRGHFRDVATNNPFVISGEGELTLGGTDIGNLGNAVGADPEPDFDSTTTRTLPASYPKGFDAFYTMKYSISQQQYVDFLNTLTYDQQDNRITGSPDDAEGTFADAQFRYAIKIKTSGIASTAPAEYETDNPFVANGFMSWMDGAAYVDWAGLRPMTELEYEKAARGPATPVADEYAWGTTSAEKATGITDPGLASETASNAGANVVVDTADPEASVPGPLRVGAFAAVGTTRAQAGASYWGVVELSGNLWERPVTVGNAEGRAFTGLHGDGVLAADGTADTANWPGTDAVGVGFRGGSHTATALLTSRVSSRRLTVFSSSARAINGGFRGVRTAPATGMED